MLDRDGLERFQRDCVADIKSIELRYRQEIISILSANGLGIGSMYEGCRISRFDISVDSFHISIHGKKIKKDGGLFSSECWLTHVRVVDLLEGGSDGS